MPQFKAEHDFALNRMRELNARLAECLADATRLRAQIVKAKDANDGLTLRLRNDRRTPAHSRKH
jgi:hypothetical protein